MHRESVSLLNQGVAHHQAGQLETAGQCYQALLSQEPDNCDAYHLLGLIAHQQGNHHESVRLISQAILGKPDFADFHSNCAEAYRAMNCFKEANTHFQLALALAPNNTKIMFNLALLLQQNNCLQAAVKHYQQALTLEPNFAQAHYQLGLALQSSALPGLGQLESASKHLLQAIALEPNNKHALNALGILQMEQGRPKEAQLNFQRALAIDTNCADSNSNLCWVFTKLDKTQQAELHGQRAIELNPASPQAHSNLGYACFAGAKLDAAIKHYENALAIDPLLSHVHCNLAIALLCRGDFARGWREFEWRVKDWSGNNYLRDPRVPVTSNANLSAQNQAILPKPSSLLPINWQHKRVLLLSDQGLGDELFYLRFIPRLLEKFNGPVLTKTVPTNTVPTNKPITKIYYRPSSKLMPLAKRLLANYYPAVDILDRKDTLSSAPIDHVFALADLPQVAGMRDQHDAMSSLRLTALDNEVSKLQNQYEHLPRPWYGISWRAGTAFEQEAGSPIADSTLDSRRNGKRLFKEVPLQALMQTIEKGLGNTGGTLFVLQREPKTNELETIKKTMNTWANNTQTFTLVDGSDLNNNLESALALLHLLDEYIGVSNTNMHLNALLDRHCHVLLPTMPEFRWTLNADPSPVAPSTAASLRTSWFPQYSLYREVDGGWQSALQALSGVLAGDFQERN